MATVFSRIAKVEKTSFCSFSVEPRRKSSPGWYLNTPPYVLRSWYCMPQFSYCGAPPGIRCSCGSQLHGHDPGDEG